MQFIKEKCSLFFFLLFIVLFFGCSNTKYLSENEALLNKSRVFLDVKENKAGKRQLKKDLELLTKQKPNERFLGSLKVKLWFYNRASQGNLNRFKNWVKNKLGETPVIYDAKISEATSNLMKNYLFNKGFFHAEVSFASFSKKRKTKIVYNITTGDRYKINKVILPEGVNRIERKMLVNIDECLLKAEAPYDIDLLQLERERIVKLLKNVGYYYFNKEYVSFELDSNKKDQTIDIEIKLHQLPDQQAYQYFTINNVYIYPDYTTEFKEATEIDTLLINNYFFVTTALKYNPKVLLDAVFISAGDLYSKEKHDRTHYRLLDIGVFKFVNIRFTNLDRADESLLDCHIYLTPKKKNEISVETELNTNTRTTSDYPLGTTINLSYKTRNLFRNADLTTINLQGGVEMQFGDSLLFNTVDITPQINFYFPKLLTPIRFQNLSKKFNPKTRISMGYNFLKREGEESYAINMINVSYGFEWKEFTFKRHILSPTVISLVNLNENATSERFFERLEKEPLLKSRFEEQLIIGSSYSFLFNNQRLDRLRDYIYFRGNIESAGLLVALSQTLVNIPASPTDDESLDLIGINYSQYVRTDIDFRYYQVFSKNRVLIYRFASGIGFPVGNSKSLPYIKQFYIGGANSVRSWRIRTLGPGSFDNTSEDVFVDQTADMRLESNLEFRFGVFGLLKGALFVDGGNMWTLKEDTLRPGAKIKEDFLSEFAIGTGVGVRLDFTYFIVRFDVAVPIRDPALPAGDRWLIDDINLSSASWRNNNIFYNLAIGYPF